MYLRGQHSEAETRTAGAVEYRLSRRRVKNINLRVRSDGSVAVSAPSRVSAAVVDEFVAARAAWVEQARRRAAQRRQKQEAQPLPDAEQALESLTALTMRWLPAVAPSLNGRVPQVKVRDMSSRWGVCSVEKCRITYALRLAGLPDRVQEYVVVHELCHFIRADHSPAFWREVEARLPDWKERRALLRRE